MSADARAETAEYSVTFESTWSATTHPLQFPINAHFSGLIGGTHNDQVTFWNVGELASLGIKNMAEQGAKTALMQEVQDAITAGTADAVLSGDGLPISPASVSLTFDVDDQFPLVTLVSMLAPSPDWFVGVSGLSLRDNGGWIPQVVVDLVVYDAGTDSGPTYASANQATMPPVPVIQNTVGPFANSSLVGTYTFTRTALLDTPPSIPDGRVRLTRVGPNPLTQSTRFELRVPSGRSGDLAVFSIGGQRIRGLFSGNTGDQTRMVQWDGSDQRGGRVPAGVYFVALRIDGAPAQTERVVVVR